MDDLGDWRVISAVVQALSAVAVVVLTFFLVRFTGRYVGEMAKANELQSAANAISSALLSRQAKQEAPFLISSRGGASGTRGGAAKGHINIQNRGGSLAHDVIVETTWGNAGIESLGPGDPPVPITLHFDGPWDAEANPAVERFAFKDPQGNSWRQRPNELPVPEADDSA